MDNKFKPVNKGENKEMKNVATQDSKELESKTLEFSKSELKQVVKNDPKSEYLRVALGTVLATIGYGVSLGAGLGNYPLISQMWLIACATLTLRTAKNIRVYSEFRKYKKKHKGEVIDFYDFVREKNRQTDEYNKAQAKQWNNFKKSIGKRR